jgi:hypothetical protein
LLDDYARLAAMGRTTIRPLMPHEDELGEPVSEASVAQG